MLSSRPSATGNTMPGNSTRLRVATIGTASAGNGGSSIRGVADMFSVSSIVLLACSREGGCSQPHFQQTIDITGSDDFHSSRQRDTSHETPMRDLEAPYDGVTITQGQGTPRADSQRIRLESDLDLFGHYTR